MFDRGSGNTFYLLNKPGVNDTYFYQTDHWRNEMSRPYVLLREEIEKAGFRFQITHDCSDLSDFAALLSFCYADKQVLKNFSKIPKNRCSIIIPEPPSLLPQLYQPCLKNFYGTIFVLLDDIVDNISYFKFHHPHYCQSPVVAVPEFSEKKLGVMIHSNLRSDHPNDLYAERHVLAGFFSNKDEFDLFGGGWEEYPTWKGYAENPKMTFLKNYKFYFAYENTQGLRGYMTERIMDAFFGGCVPIYWGAPNITDYVPKECFVDRRDFASNEELYLFMKSMDPATYDAYRASGQMFLKTPQAEVFSPVSFAQSIVRQMMKTI